jgi:hypothetical protein
LRNKSQAAVAQTEVSHVLVDTEIALHQRRSGGRPFIPEEPGRVSVVIASHDRFDSLLESIESVRRQTYSDWEIIVVNDASVDPRYYALIEVRAVQRAVPTRFGTESFRNSIRLAVFASLATSTYTLSVTQAAGSS